MRQIQLSFFGIDEETKAQLSNFLGLYNKSVVGSGYESRKSNKGYTLNHCPYIFIWKMSIGSNAIFFFF